MTAPLTMTAIQERQRLDPARSFLELERISRVNERARAANRDPAFSQRSREGLPMPLPPR
jgi:hypothetical protein